MNASPSEALAAGTRVDRWIVEGVRSEGGFALVHRARDAVTGEPAAIKVLRRALSFHGNAVTRFHREIGALARVAHPNVVRALAHGDLADGRPWLAMPWLDGDDLRARLARKGALSIEEARAIVEPLADALHHVHAHDLVHRDVKAENVMLHDGVPVLVDFGVARDDDPAQPIALTTHSSLGTPCAMAPEQIMGTRVDGRTDVYGLGVLLFQLVTGSLPFRSENLPELLEMHLHAPPPLPSSRAPVAAEIDALVVRCMAKDPRDRPQTARAVAEELAAALDRSRLPSAIYVEARIAADDPSDEVLDDVEAAIAIAADTLRPDAVVDVHANAVLALLAVDAERACALAARIADALSSRRGRSSSVRVAATVHLARSRDELRAPSAWAAPVTEDGAFATLAAKSGDPVAGTTLVRLR